MERKYTILAGLLIILALGLVILPKKKDLPETDPRVLLSLVAEKSRYLSVDQITHRIIENDPTLMLIDLRPANEFKAFALPGAINILPDSLLTATTLQLLSQSGKDKVFYANADQLAEKAWLTGTRYSVGRLYVMKGGLNEWFNTIIKPNEISATASSSEHDLASFRAAARQFFTGAGDTPTAPVATKKREKIEVVRKAPEPTSGGGC
jgi:rhodanese-related sulfurtransferase